MIWGNLINLCCSLTLCIRFFSLSINQEWKSVLVLYIHILLLQTHYVLLLCSFKEQLQQHVRVHAMEAVMACWDIEQSLQSLTGILVVPFCVLLLLASMRSLSLVSHSSMELQLYPFLIKEPMVSYWSFQNPIQVSENFRKFFFRN